MADTTKTAEQIAAEEKAKQHAARTNAPVVNKPAGQAPSRHSASPGSVVNSPGDTAEQEPSTFTAEELHDMRGDLLPGELGWVKLDEEGHPTGEVTREIPEVGETVARVVGVTHSYDELVTPSGAPLTKQMNPEPSLWDDGMRARNPIPEEVRDPDREAKEAEHDRQAKRLGLKK